MKKRLFKNSQDFDAWLNELVHNLDARQDATFGALEELEYFFGILLLNSEGKTFEESEDQRQDGEPDTWEAANPVQYRINDEHRWEAHSRPESFPCLQLSWLENTADRMGDVTIRVVEYAYPADFEDATQTPATV